MLILNRCENCGDSFDHPGEASYCETCDQIYQAEKALYKEFIQLQLYGVLATLKNSERLIGNGRVAKLQQQLTAINAEIQQL